MSNDQFSEISVNLTKNLSKETKKIMEYIFFLDLNSTEEDDITKIIKEIYTTNSD